jgi:SAM-dependent methyltransferase
MTRKMHEMHEMHESARPADWGSFAAGFARLRPPMRVSPSDAETMRAAIEGSDGEVLLLGVTPELAGLGKRLVAIDKEPRVIAEVWPGDDPQRRAVLADWLDLPLEAERFDAVIGDGSYNAVGNHAAELLREVKRVLAPGGTVSLRVFCSPAKPESFDDISGDVTSGWNGNAHALAWRIGMALAPANHAWVVSLPEIAAAFDALFPDREALCASTGWSGMDMAVFDRFAMAERSLAMPPQEVVLRSLERVFSHCRAVSGSGYPLAERCPTFICSGKR